ncbi:LemA family protein [Candidatus Woesearchaeota archaeon]|nr:LemA family protein [Candidatus Woesearchaeota archaeon]
MNKKGLSTGAIIGIIIAAVVVLVLLWFALSYNGLVKADEGVNEKWANVQSAYQRRADLIPNLVETVKAYSNYEGEVLTEITDARASMSKATTPGQLQAADAQLTSALSRLLVVVENYPNLKANENYLSLQDELAGTENRVKTERDVFNKAVRDYNVKVRAFPSNIVAGMFGFATKESFEADEGTDKAPKVNFG